MPEHVKSETKVFTDIGALKAFIAKERETYGWPVNVGLITGCFDLLHAGHTQVLRRAGERCDILIAAVTPDAAVASRKGEERPFRPQETRVLDVAMQPDVQAVLLTGQGETDVKKLWPKVCHELKPDILFVGDDHREEAGASYDVPAGTQIHMIDSPDGKRFGTTDYLNNIKAKLHRDRAGTNGKE